MKKITKAVIPAAGLGTRMLPIARAVAKEMLPIVDRPAISYLVEEAKKSGITDILIIMGRGKGAIEDYFDMSPEYEESFREKGRESDIRALREEYEGVNIFYIRQHRANGLGAAILAAESFTGDEPFAVLYGDDIIFSEKPVTRQLMDAYEALGEIVVGVQSVPPSDLVKYSTLLVDRFGDNLYKVLDMKEKPQSEDEILSDLAILGRVILTPYIYKALRNTPLGHGGELQLTDALASMSREGAVSALYFDGKRYDLGSKAGFIKANVDLALQHPETAEEIKEYIKSLNL